MITIIPIIAGVKTTFGDTSFADFRRRPRWHGRQAPIVTERDVSDDKGIRSEEVGQQKESVCADGAERSYKVLPQPANAPRRAWGTAAAAASPRLSSERRPRRWV